MAAFDAWIQLFFVPIDIVGSGRNSLNRSEHSVSVDVVKHGKAWYFSHNELERSTMLLVGKSTISMGHGFNSYFDTNQRVKP